MSDGVTSKTSSLVSRAIVGASSFVGSPPKINGLLFIFKSIKKKKNAKF